MQLSKLIKFEPINLTSIIITILILAVLTLFFNQQVADFLSRVEKFEAGADGISLTATPAVHPLEQVGDNFQNIVKGGAPLDLFRKSTISDLNRSLDNIRQGDQAVISFVVDGNAGYYDDAGMLDYLSIAAEKVKYLAFYNNGKLVGAIAIEAVISGLANGSEVYARFGDRLNNGEWRYFPNLISDDQVFSNQPSLEELYQRLLATGHSAIPLVNNDKLVGFLDYKSIADELYTQAKGSQRI